MKCGVKSLLVTLALTFCIVPPALAGSYLDGLIKAAEQGDAGSQVQLGAMYLLGQGVPQDSAKAVALYLRAAEQGHAYAQYDLGAMYAEGTNTPQDYVAAYKWLSLAAAQGVKMAMQFRNDVTRKMTPAQTAEAQQQVRQWTPKK
jgi:hypothetical protein